MHNAEPRPDDVANAVADAVLATPPAKTPGLHFGRLLLVCALAAVFCGVLVWFATTYMRNCCAP